MTATSGKVSTIISWTSTFMRMIRRFVWAYCAMLQVDVVLSHTRRLQPDARCPMYSATLDTCLQPGSRHPSSG